MSDDRPPRRAPDPPTEWIPRVPPEPLPSLSPNPPREPSQVIHRDPTQWPTDPIRKAAPPVPPRPPGIPQSSGLAVPPLVRRPPPPPPLPPPPRIPSPPPPRHRPQQVTGGTWPAAPPQGSRQRKPRWGRRILASLVVTVLVALTAIIGGGAWLDSALRRVSVFSEYAERPAEGTGTTWLLVGSDSREGLTPEQQAELTTGDDMGNGRTDTIIVVHVPSLTSSAPTTMVSIPRDSYVDIPGYGKDKINAAFAQGGAPLLAQTVEEATGLHLDHYAELGFGGFAAVVDALGGVQICPPDPIDDELAGIDLPAGCQTVDGRNALGYVRTRATPRADLDRMVHQRQFMEALLSRANSPAVWLNPWRWYAVPRATVAALTVDDGAHVWDLARLGWGLHGSMTTVTVPVAELTSNSSGSVVVWDTDKSAALFDALRTDAAIPQSVLDAQP